MSHDRTQNGVGKSLGELSTASREFSGVVVLYGQIEITWNSFFSSLPICRRRVHALFDMWDHVLGAQNVALLLADENERSSASVSIC